MNTQGQQREKEAAAYEARMFCEMLLKGAVNVFEVNVVWYWTSILVDYASF